MDYFYLATGKTEEYVDTLQSIYPTLLESCYKGGEGLRRGGHACMSSIGIHNFPHKVLNKHITDYAHH